MILRGYDAGVNRNSLIGPVRWSFVRNSRGGGRCRAEVDPGDGGPQLPGIEVGVSDADVGSDPNPW
jgi:hypothetical protein